jgi:hypothetical protein
MWNPPTGPPNGVPLRPADARREVEEAVNAARARDAELREEVAAEAGRSIHAAAGLDEAAAEADDAAELAKRALERSHQSALAGQRAEAAKWTAAAQVFAVRLHDARALVAELERRLARGAEQSLRAEAALDANVGRLRAVAAARLPLLAGRRGSRAERELDDAVAVLSVPADEEIARAIDEARAAAAQAAAGPPTVDVTPVADDELESEVDLGRADDVLDELRSELGLEPVGGGDRVGGDPVSGEPGVPDSGAGGPSAPLHAGRG